MKFIAFVTKGLEDISKAELESFGAKIEKIETKRIYFSFEEDVFRLKSLKTVDDIAILLFEGNFDGVDNLKDRISEINLEVVMNYLKTIRDLDNSFSITASIFKNKEFTQDGIKNLVASVISEKYNWEFTRNNHKNFDVRINVEESMLILSIKLFENPLYEREYKTDFKIGSLKPTIAAALVQMLNVESKNLKLIDNFCGSGTILCEAFLNGFDVYGSDIDSKSVENTIRNLENLGFKNAKNFKVQDAMRTKWKAEFFDIAISNLPWDEKIKVNNLTKLYDESMKEYKRIMKKNSKMCFLVKKPELFINFVKKYFSAAKIEQRQISFNGQMPSVVIVANDSNSI